MSDLSAPVRSRGCGRTFAVMKKQRKDMLIGDEVAPKPDASKFLMLIPQSQLQCWDVADVSQNTFSKDNDSGAVVVAVVFGVRCLS